MGIQKVSPNNSKPTNFPSFLFRSTFTSGITSVVDLYRLYSDDMSLWYQMNADETITKYEKTWQDFTFLMLDSRYSLCGCEDIWSLFKFSCSLQEFAFPLGPANTSYTYDVNFSKTWWVVVLLFERKCFVHQFYLIFSYCYIILAIKS